MLTWLRPPLVIAAVGSIGLVQYCQMDLRDGFTKEAKKNLPPGKQCKESMTAKQAIKLLLARLDLFLRLASISVM